MATIDEPLLYTHSYIAINFLYKNIPTAIVTNISSIVWLSYFIDISYPCKYFDKPVRHMQCRVPIYLAAAAAAAEKKCRKHMDACIAIVDIIT